LAVALDEVGALTLKHGVEARLPLLYTCAWKLGLAGTPPVEQPVVVIPPLAVEHVIVPGVVLIVAALAKPASVPTMAFELVEVVELLAIGTCPGV